MYPTCCPRWINSTLLGFSINMIRVPILFFCLPETRLQSRLVLQAGSPQAIPPSLPCILHLLPTAYSLPSSLSLGNKSFTVSAVKQLCKGWTELAVPSPPADSRNWCCHALVGHTGIFTFFLKGCPEQPLQGRGGCLTIHKLGHCTETDRAFAMLEQKVSTKAVVSEEFCEKHPRRCPWELVSMARAASSRSLNVWKTTANKKPKEHKGKRRTPRNYVQWNTARQTKLMLIYQRKTRRKRRENTHLEEEVDSTNCQRHAGKSGKIQHTKTRSREESRKK